MNTLFYKAKTFAGVAIASAAMLGASVGLATAAEMRMGNVTVNVNTTTSFGISQRIADRENAFLPARNVPEGETGGKPDMTVGGDAIMATRDCGTASNPSDGALSYGSHCMYDNTILAGALAALGRKEIYNYDGSINTDDGRLNFGNGDMTGMPAKLTADIEANMGMVRAFTRLNFFYDAILSGEDNFARSGLMDDGTELVGAGVQLLDAYVDFDLNVAGNPLLIRAGKQVINWGEATFILGGNSVFNAINVPAFRRPGSEIKEALLPVMAVYGSYSLTDSLSLEAYVGGWDKYLIDPGGSPFANSDAFQLGSTASDLMYKASDYTGTKKDLNWGNGARFYVGSGAFSGAGKRNCMDTGATASATTVAAASPTGLYIDAVNKVFGTCETNSILHFATPNEKGYVERDRQRIVNTVIAGRDKAGTVLRDTDFLERHEDDSFTEMNGNKVEEPSGFDNLGLALRWYSESLGSTEFGFYYQKYNSRIPYVSSYAYRPHFGPNVTTPTASSTLRGATAQGCSGTYAATSGTGLVANADLATLYAADPTGVWAETRKLYEAGSTSRTALIGAATTNFGLATKAFTVAEATLAGRLAAGDPSLTGTDLTAAQAAAAKITAASADIGTKLGTIIDGALAIPDKDGNINMAQAAVLGCMGVMAQATGGSLLPTGASTIATRYNIGLMAEYPEIEVVGVSFNTTLLGWGVQGEIAVRPNMPLQVDTDAMSIAALGAACAWENFSGAAAIYYGLQTYPTKCGQWNEVFHGYVEEQVINLDIGTTATFTRSNPVVGLLGADLGILLTELGVVQVDGAEARNKPNNKYTAATLAMLPTDKEKRVDHDSRPLRLANICTSGSDLPLGGVFALDPRSPLKADNSVDSSKTPEECRPTDMSAGFVLLTQLQYNNVFGTALGINPTLVYQTGLSGYSPSPAGSFREGSSTLGVSLQMRYQDAWTGSIGVTMYDGDMQYDRNIDRDTLSASISYAF